MHRWLTGRPIAALLGFLLGACGQRSDTVDERTGDAYDATIEAPTETSRSDALEGSVGEGSEFSDVEGVTTTCNDPNDCVLVPRSCCETCGEPTPMDVTAITRGSEEALSASLCGPDPMPCPVCATTPNPSLFAACDDGQCKAVDLREDEASQCETEADCQVRPAACCECGAGTGADQIVAVNPEKADAFEASLCPEEVACAECAWEAPNEVSVACAGGHCELIDMRIQP